MVNPLSRKGRISCFSLPFLSSTHLVIAMSCRGRACVADECLQPIPNLLDKCSVNLYNRYVWWLWELWITGCLGFIFLFGSITKTKDPPPFSSLLHHPFQPTQKELDISGSVLAPFFQYILISFSVPTQNCAFWSIAVHYHMGWFPWE